MSVGGGIGAVVGGVLGFFIGGPVGIVYGAALGFSLGMLIDPMTPDVTSVGDPAPTTEKVGVTPNSIGIPIPDLLGTGSIKGNLLFYGGERSEPIYSESATTGGKGGGGEDPPKQITGYNYYMSWGIGLCIGPIDEIYSIWQDDKCIWSGNLIRPCSGGKETIVIDELGSATVMFGTQDQTAISSVGSIIPDSTLNTPYRGLCWIYFNNCHIGTSNRMPSIRIVLRKTPELSFNSNNLIQTHDYNPIHTIWYILNTLTGLPESWLNETTFSDVADAIYAENRGISILFSKQQKALDYIESINAHIDGITLYKNDGKFHPKIIRDDYGSSLPTINESVLLDEPTFNRGSWIDTINEIKVLYSEILGATTYYYIMGVGQNYYYELGLGDGNPRTEFTGLDFEDKIKELSFNGLFTMVIKNDGTLWSCGSNTKGQLGHGDLVGRIDLTQVGTDTDWEKVSTGGLHALAIKKDKTLWVCGWNWHGELGVGDRSRRWTFTQTGIDHDWDKVSAGINHSLFLNTSGQLYGAGNGNGLDLPGWDNQNIVKLNDYFWREICAGQYFSMLIKSDRTLYSTGYNHYGQLGLGYISVFGVMIPLTKVPGIYDGNKLPSSTMQNSLLIKEDGTLWGCGINTHSCLGLGHTNAVSTFTQIGTDTDWVKAESCDSHCMALKSDKSLWGAGLNSNGELGITDLVNRSYFTQTTDKDEWEDVACGTSNTIGIKYFYNVPKDTYVDFRESISSPTAIDEGNISVQERTVSKSMQMALYTNNENAVWAARQNLQKSCYPYAEIKCIVNRNLFRLEVGDCFYFSYAPYNVTNMICRVMNVAEKDISSENITITAIEDVFGITRARVDYEDPRDNTQNAADFSIEPFDYERIVEAPYVLTTGTTALIPIAGRKSLLDLGFYLYMSIDDGNSYNLLDAFGSLMPHGTLVDEYSDTYTIDNEVGFTIDFDFTEDVNQYETEVFSNVLVGNNTALLGDEIISVQTITPDVDNKYILTDIIRGRYGTEKETHSAGTEFYFINLNIGKATNNEIIPNVTRKFKLVPYNNHFTGDISECAVITVDIIGVAKTPYKPINFLANDGSYAARYSDDVVLTWSPRYRGVGSGIGVPGVVSAQTDREGLFRIEVFVNDIEVREITDINAATYTYTEAMNLTDNGTLADSITFKLYNFREEENITYETEAVEVVCKKEL